MLIRATPTNDNGLSRYSNAYLSDEKFEELNSDMRSGLASSKKHSDIKKRYIVLEIQNIKVFEVILNDALKRNQMIATMM